MKLKFTVSYDGNGSTGGAVPTDGSGYDKNANATVLGNSGNLAKTGYTFAGWNTAADGNGTSYAPGDSVNVGATGVRLYAKWTVNNYAVTYDSNGATSGAAPAGGSYPYNSVITLPGAGSMVRTGYTFAGWNTAANGSGTNYAAGSTYTIGAAPATLYAKWTINQYTVTFNTDGGSPVSNQTINYGAAVAQPANPTKTGHTFAGWYTDAGLTTAYNFSTPIGAANFTLYAKWDVNSYTITYNGNGNESGSVPSNGSHSYNSSVTVPGNSGALAKTGYSFAGWNTSADGSGTNYAESASFTMGAANVTLYAKWTINSYTVTYDGNGATSGSAPSGGSHEYNTVVAVSGNAGGLAKTGYTFAGWNTEANGSGTVYDASDTFPIGAADVTLYAQWTINSYELTYDGNGETSGSAPSRGEYEFGSSVTVPGNAGDLAKTGHTFAGWNTAANGGGTDYAAGSTYTVGASDATLYAKWTVNQYTVSFDSGGGTPVSNQPIDYGSTATEPAAPTKTGYTFAGWYTDADLTAAYDFASPIGAADLTLYAK
ncbi:InlB B-repeat-containing protein, partial [Paenibacillus antri]